MVDPASGWSRWTPQGRPAVDVLGAPATVSRNSRVANIYVRGSDNMLWQRAYYDGDRTVLDRPMQDGGELSAEVAVSSMGPGSELVFARGLDGNLWQKWWFGDRSREIVIFLGKVHGPLDDGCAAYPLDKPGAIL